MFPPQGVQKGKARDYVVVAASDSANKNIADYICTGTDDQNILNQAISDAKSKGISKIKLLNGTYVFNTMTEIRSKGGIHWYGGWVINNDNIEIEGESRDGVILKIADNICSGDNVYHVVEINGRTGIKIKNATISAGTQTAGNTAGIDILDSSDIEVENVKIVSQHVTVDTSAGIIVNHTSGGITKNIRLRKIYIDDSTVWEGIFGTNIMDWLYDTGENIVIEDCYIRTYYDPIYLTVGSRIRIINNELLESTNLSYVGYIIWESGSSDIICENNLIVNSSISATAEKADIVGNILYLTQRIPGFSGINIAGQYANVSSNIIIGTSGIAVNDYSNVSDNIIITNWDVKDIAIDFSDFCTISNNLIYSLSGQDGEGIYSASSNGSIVVGNVVYGVGQTAIDLRYFDNGICSFNNVYNCSALGGNYGIRIFQSKNSIFKGNKITGSNYSYVIYAYGNCTGTKFELNDITNASGTTGKIYDANSYVKYRNNAGFGFKTQTITVTAGSTYVLDEGEYYVFLGANTSLEVYDGTTWKTIISVGGSGYIKSDGTNVRLNNTGAANEDSTLRIIR